MSNSKTPLFTTRNLVQLALLTAIIIVMSFTPIGYLKTPIVEITFIPIPVVIGAIVIGPSAGAFLGAVFGLTSFIQCFGMSQFGAMLLSINPIFTFIMCFVARLLMGWLCGLIFKAFYRFDKSSSKLVSYGAASLSGALLNTLFFVALLLLLFGNTDFVQSFGDTVFGIIATIVGVNGLVEALVCMIVGAAVSKAIDKIFRRTSKTNTEQQ
ncbi:MAG: ECF transporter S component [Ruminococcaceae bacterium]|nr:ECF transporter S component [Oscillospiraceae bacterium]